MQKVLVLAAALLAPSSAAAQEKRPNEEKCLQVLEVRGSNLLSIRNRCTYPVFVQFFDGNTNKTYEREMKPNDVEPIHDNVWGTACRIGYVSEIPLEPKNRDEILKYKYSCVKK